MNLILRKRVIRLIATSYAMNEDELWAIYEKLENIEKLLNMLETNKLQQIIKEIQ